MTAQDEILVFAGEATGAGASPGASLTPLSTRGSDRTFYRFSFGAGSAICIDYDPKRTENSYYADIASFLMSNRVPVPAVIGHDATRHFLVMEDLGDEDLYAFADRDWAERRVLYHKTLGAIRRLHAIPVENLAKAGVTVMEGFGPELYLFEQNYFLNHFVKGYCEVDPEASFQERLRTELHSLAERLQSVKTCLIHRDFQSQNVMVRQGEPWLIDFQGMRPGNPFYDLGSLLLDPYVSIGTDEREELLSFYYVLSSQELDWDAFQQCFWEASAQRLMQALGAYGFLGRSKGLMKFLEYIPQGVDNLSLAVSHVPSLQCLRDLLVLCRLTLD